MWNWPVQLKARGGCRITLMGLEYCSGVEWPSVLRLMNPVLWVSILPWEHAWISKLSYASESLGWFWKKDTVSTSHFRELCRLDNRVILIWAACDVTWDYGVIQVRTAAQSHVWVHGTTAATVWTDVCGFCCHWGLCRCPGPGQPLEAILVS